MTVFSGLVLPGLLLLLTLAFGFWLSHLGQPYHGVLFNVHKLLALGAVVLAGLWIFRLPEGVAAQRLLPALLVVAALGVVALFASGGLMSAGKLDQLLMVRVHQVALVVLLLAVIGAVYLLRGVL